MFLSQRTQNPDAAAYVADHLAAAGRPGELMELVLLEDYPAGIGDGLRREQVQARRLDLAARAAADISDAASAVRLAARSCDTASRTDTLSKLVESRLDLVARYTDIDLLRTHALHSGRHDWLAPTLMRLAAVLSRRPGNTRRRPCGVGPCPRMAAPVDGRPRHYHQPLEHRGRRHRRRCGGPLPP